jgi:hypothetical protein
MGLQAPQQVQRAAPLVAGVQHFEGVSKPTAGPACRSSWGHCPAVAGGRDNLPMTVSETQARRAPSCARSCNHAHLYYVLDAPELPDAEYDRCSRSCRRWRRPTRAADADSPTQRVIGAVLDGSRRCAMVPMLSITTETDTSEARSPSTRACAASWGWPRRSAGGVRRS